MGSAAEAYSKRDMEAEDYSRSLLNQLEES